MAEPYGSGSIEADDWPVEVGEWLEALEAVRAVHGEARVRELLAALHERMAREGTEPPPEVFNTPYCNSIPFDRQPIYPGDQALEERIESILRWNAMAMVVRASDRGDGVGGHIATYASTATLLEVGFNHFFRNRGEGYGGDVVNVQPHAAPGIYARAYLEGRLDDRQLDGFRRELQPGGGLSSYPHPRRMPELWPYPTASMGLSALISVKHAQIARYLEHRGLKPANGGKVWCFLGDGEMDEPEVMSSLQVAGRERLDNLVFVVNCNLQRLDGPVRGNGKIIQELERLFRGAGWHVVKVIWGSEWDALLARDRDGVLLERMGRALDGDYQMYTVSPGDAVRAHWVEGNPRLAELMASWSDEEIRTVRRGGHDRLKVYAAYRRAAEVEGRPVVVLAKTIKGYGLGPRGEGRNTTHQKKSLSAEERRECARQWGIPLSDAGIRRADFYRPPPGSPERRYLEKRREALGGFQPNGGAGGCSPLRAPGLSSLQSLLAGSDKPISTTMGFVRALSRLLRDPEIGRYLVPIVADESRTFGMDGLLSQAGIYSAAGQRYRPVDADTITPYRESRSGQILQEGICEAGAMASFLAAGTAWRHHGVPAIPFYVFYSMFGFQRVGDLIWACGDALCRGFLVGGTAGRTTLNGEGVQHQDGQSPLSALTVPNLRSYDPAFAYEVAVLLRDGIHRMYERQEDVFYYLTLYNEPYPMPAMPEGAEEGIVRGIYRFRPAPPAAGRARVHLLGSGSLMTEVLRAQETLAGDGIAADVWSVTSYAALYRDAVEAERWNREHPDRSPRKPYLTVALPADADLFVAVTDYVHALPLSVARWVPGPLVTLGTDGYGLSETRGALRGHFDVDAAGIVRAVHGHL